MIEFKDGRVFPMSLSEVPLEMLDLWNEYASRIGDSPAAQSRFNELIDLTTVPPATPEDPTELDKPEYRTTI